MPDAALITGFMTVWRELGAAAAIGFLFLVYISLTKGDGRKPKPVPIAPPDPKHEENQGMIREAQQLTVSGIANLSRTLEEHGRRFDNYDKRFDDIDDTLRRMETIGEVLKDRAPR